jgi:hypothetical protein
MHPSIKKESRTSSVGFDPRDSQIISIQGNLTVQTNFNVLPLLSCLRYDCYFSGRGGGGVIIVVILGGRGL